AHERGEGEPVGGRHHRERPLAKRERLAGVGGDRRATGRPAARRVGRREERRGGLPPPLGVAGRCEDGPGGVEDRAAAQVGGHLAHPDERPLRAGRAHPRAVRLVARRRPAHGFSANIPAVSLERAYWLAVVGACAIAALILAIKGYVGYPIVIAAVGAAAAVNLV